MKYLYTLFFVFFTTTTYAASTNQIFEGTVIHGNHHAREFNFPTANIHAPESSQLDRGVYVGTAQYDGKKYLAIFYAGPNRNQTNTPPRNEVLEVHLMGFKGDLYGKKITATVMDMVRQDLDMPYNNWQSFKERMSAQIQEDVKNAEILFANMNP